MRMKKTWVKRENIYYVPFYKQRSEVLLLGIFLVGIIFFLYQAISINQLVNTSTPWSLEGTMQGIKRKHKQIQASLGKRQTENYSGRGGAGAGVNDKGGGNSDSDVNEILSSDSIGTIKGIRRESYGSYKPTFAGKFRCLDGSLEIPFERVNDDYCDCVLDGSDEPSTNACSNGRFYCTYQTLHGLGQNMSVPSSRVNDGICDCCDGSDEWLRPKCRNNCLIFFHKT